MLEWLNWKLKLPLNHGCPSLMRMTISYWLGILWWLKSRGLGAHIFPQSATVVVTGHFGQSGLAVDCFCCLHSSSRCLVLCFSKWSIQWWMDGHQFGRSMALFSQLVQDLSFSFKVSLKHFFWPFVLFPYCSWEQKICLERRVFGHSDTVTSPSKSFFDDDRVSTDHFGFDKDIKAKC